MKNRNKWFAISLVMYLLSLPLTAFTYGEKGSFLGVELLIAGTFSILGGAFMEWVIWLANPLFWIALFMFYKGNLVSRKYALAACIFSLSFLFWSEVPGAENGRHDTIHHLYPGYWLWALSMLVLAIGTHRHFKA